jgi:hypothetical protein
MIPVDLPDLPRRAWLGVTIERQELAGSEAFSVTVHEGMSRTPRRRWFPDRTLALLHGADMADAHGLPLFDRTICETAA